MKKYKEYFKINEQNSFNIGDKVRILPITAKYIVEYDWLEEMNDTIGKIGIITKSDEDEYRNNIYDVKFDDNKTWYYFEDCLEKEYQPLDPPLKIKWYKNGKFEKDRTNESMNIDKIKVGDSVELLSKILKYINNNGWPLELADKIGKIGEIRKFGHTINRPLGAKRGNAEIIFIYSINIDDRIYDIPADCVKKVEEKLKIKWYKKGNFFKDGLKESIEY